MKSVSLLCYLLLMVMTMNVNADWTEETSALEIRGLLQTGVFLTPGNNGSIAALTPKHLLTQSARVMVAAEPTTQWSAEMHAVADWVSSGLANSTYTHSERSPALDWHSNNNRTSVSLDRLNLQYQSEQLRIKGGRLPVNLSRSSYFAPLDWFAPFSAETFFRVYKPGVDALRLDLETSDLSHLSLVQVQGYQKDPTTVSGWSNHVDRQHRSTIAQLSLTRGNFQWDVLAARVRGHQLLGIALQGELWQWLGLRAEGYHSAPTTTDPAFDELTLELEHRWPNSLTMHLAAFWHGAGADSVSGYPAVITLAQTRSPYLANQYQLLAMDFDMTPLVSTSALLIRNGVDHSRLLALYARYSTGDESELTLGANLPAGGRVTATEFGQYPRALNLQFRYYF